MEMEVNPYAAPQSQALRPPSSQDETIREEHIKTEASIKSVGFLFYLGALILLAVSVSVVASFTRGNSTGILFLGLIGVLFAFGTGATAYGLRRLRSWSRISTIILSSIALVIGLMNLSAGIVIHIYILSMMLGKKARFIMTPEYQQIIAATPHVKHKTSIVVKVLLALLLILLVGIIAAAFFNK